MESPTNATLIRGVKVGGKKDEHKDQLTAGRLCSLSPRAESTARQSVGSSQPQRGKGEGKRETGRGGGGGVADGWESLTGLSEEVW